MWSTWNSHTLLVGLQIDIITWKWVWQFLIKLNVLSTCYGTRVPGGTLLGNAAYVHRETYTSFAFFFNSQKDADTKGYAWCDSSYIKFKVELAERNARSIRDPGWGLEILCFDWGAGCVDVYVGKIYQTVPLIFVHFFASYASVKRGKIH